MPLTDKDKKILASMKSTYKGDSEKAKRVFYASAQMGKLGKDVKKRHGAAAHRKKE